MSISTGTALDGRWELGQLFAAGGMGDVYRSRDLATDSDVAVKVLRAGVSDGVRRFAAEAEALRRLQHPNIVQLIDAGTHDGRPYLVMEFVEGRSFAELLGGRPLPLEDVRLTGTQIASALAFAHDAGVVHRDVKPANVLIDLRGEAHLADFGIARMADVVGVTATGMSVGTAGYVAPEQLTDSRAVGPAADVYALGLVLLEAATGRRTFSGAPTEAAFARLSRDPEVSNLPAPWRRLLRSMTAREPGARPEAGTVVEVLRAGLPLDRTDTLRLPPAPSAPPAWASEAPAEAPVASPVELQADELPADAPAMASHGEATAHLAVGTAAETPPSEVAGDAPSQEGRAADASRLPGWLRLGAVAVTLLVVLALALTTLGPGGTDEPEPTPAPAPAGDLPPPLEDAFGRLRDQVQP